MDAVISEKELKRLLKTAVAEVIEERRDFIVEAMEEAMEDVALSRAIKEGEKSPFVSRAEVMRALGRKK